MDLDELKYRFISALYRIEKKRVFIIVASIVLLLLLIKLWR